MYINATAALYSKMYSFGMTLLLSKSLASLMRNYFPKRPSSALLHTLSKLYDVPVGFVAPSYFETVYCFTVAEGWLLLDIG